MFVGYLDRTWIGKLPITRDKTMKDPLFKFTLWNKGMEVREDIPTTNNSNDQWNQSIEPNASLWTIIAPTSYVKSPCRGKLFLIQPVVQTALRTLANKNREIKVQGLKT